jgi:hypothetical protein
MLNHFVKKGTVQEREHCGDSPPFAEPPQVLLHEGPPAVLPATILASPRDSETDLVTPGSH